MPRTTIDIDASVLRELKRIQRREKKTLAQVVTELLARALAEGELNEELPPLKWTAARLGLKVDLQDKEAVRRILDQR